jgi:hypothetical protein
MVIHSPDGRSIRPAFVPIIRIKQVRYFAYNKYCHNKKQEPSLFQKEGHTKQAFACKYIKVCMLITKLFSTRNED